MSILPASFLPDKGALGRGFSRLFLARHPSALADLKRAVRIHGANLFEGLAGDKLIARPGKHFDPLAMSSEFVDDSAGGIEIEIVELMAASISLVRAAPSVGTYS